MLSHEAGIVYKGKLLPEKFPNNIVAGQWAYNQGLNPKDFQIVNLLPNGEINHRAIIQIYDARQGRIILENHYTICGTFHFPWSHYEVDKAHYENLYKGNKDVRVSAWIDS